MKELDYLRSRISELKKRRNQVVINIRGRIHNIKKLRQYISDDIQLQGYSHLCSSLVDERNLLKSYSKDSKDIKEEIKILNRLLDTIKKHNKDKEIPEYGCFKTVYYRGEKSHWQVGDKLAYYEFCTDHEGEYDLGTITKIEFDKKLDNWVYTFDDPSETELSEEELLDLEVYKYLKK